MAFSVSWRALALSATGVLGALILACNAISGADALASDPSSDEAPITGGHRTTSSSTSSSSGSTSSSTSTSTSSGGSGTTVADPHGGHDASADGSPTSSSTDASFDSATTSGPSLADDFNRGDGPNIGNGWLQKTASKYSLSNGTVLQSGDGVYTNNIVYRTETSVDVQLSIDVVYGPDFDTDACLHARLQGSSLTQNQLDGYTFYAYPDFSAIELNLPGSNGTELTSVMLSPQLTVGETYHMNFRVTGSNPVTLQGSITDANGGTVAALTANDASPSKVVTPGMVGFGAGKASGTRWDNFVRVDF